MGLKEIIGTTIIRLGYVKKKEYKEKEYMGKYIDYNAEELGVGAVCDVNFLKRLRSVVYYSDKKDI